MRKRFLSCSVLGILALFLVVVAPSFGESKDRDSDSKAPSQAWSQGMESKECHGPRFGRDASRATGSVLDEMRNEALAAPEVQTLREFLIGRGYSPQDEAAFGTASGQDDAVFLPFSKPDDARRQGALIAYVRRADGTRTIEAATMTMKGRRVSVSEEFEVKASAVVKANSFISCLVACTSVKCTRIARCPTFLGPQAFLACAAAVCGAQVPGCVRLCR